MGFVFVLVLVFFQWVKSVEEGAGGGGSACVTGWLDQRPAYSSPIRPNNVLWRMKGGACWTVPLCSAWKTGAAYDFRYRAPAILNDLFTQQSDVPHKTLQTTIARIACEIGLCLLVAGARHPDESANRRHSDRRRDLNAQARAGLTYTQDLTI